VSAVLIGFVLRKVDWSALGAVLRALDWRWAVTGSACTVLLIGGLALRWRLFLHQQGLFVSYGTIFRLTWIGQFFNSILPGSTGGDVYKLVQVCRLAPDRKAAAASTVFIDRLSALLALLVIAATALLLDPRLFAVLPLSEVRVGTLLAAAAAGTAALAIVVILLNRSMRGAELLGRVRRTLAAARGSLVLNGATITAVMLAFTIHLLNFLIIYLFARALRLDISYAEVVAMMSIVLLVVMVPITINGHGLREILLTGYFQLLGVAVVAGPSGGVREAAVALSLLLVTSDLLWSALGGVVYASQRAEAPGRSPSAASFGRGQ
jgi:glycosyltransferase 2 family protein